jgi:hypothetical protein
MKESVLRDLLAGNLVKLVAGGLQGVYPDAFRGEIARAQGNFTIQSPVVLSQLVLSPASQILSLLIMETDSMVRAGKRLFPEKAREEALKLVVSANAEVLNFAAARLAWLLAKLEGLRSADLSPPKVSNFSQRAFRVRGEEGACLEFRCPAHNLSFKYVASIQSVPG